MEPEWLAALRARAAATSQAATARELGLSRTTVSQVLAGKYAAGTGRIEALVRGTYLNAKRTCPELGEISIRRCEDEQKRPFAATSHVRVALWRACQTCKHRRIG